jgi:hypothetical protein
MALDSLGFRFALILGFAIVVLMITTWLEWAAPISEPVYRAQIPYYF